MRGQIPRVVDLDVVRGPGVPCRLLARPAEPVDGAEGAHLVEVAELHPWTGARNILAEQLCVSMKKISDIVAETSRISNSHRGY